MAAYKGQNCKRCNKPRSEVGDLSYRGFCENCGTGQATKQQTQLANRTGEYFKDWRRRTADSVGAILIEDIPPEIRELIPNL